MLIGIHLFLLEMCLSHWVWDDLEFPLRMKYLCPISSDTQFPLSQVMGLLRRLNYDISVLEFCA